MRNSVVIGTIVAVMVMGLAQGALGQIISIEATQDTFIDQTTPDTTHNAGGLLMKGQSGQRRVTIIEFLIPDVELDVLNGGEAMLNVCHIRSWSSLSWVMNVRGKQDSFANYGLTEATATYNNRSGLVDTADLLYDAVTMSGGNGGDGKDVVPPEWHNFDITAFFNANQGQTVLFILRNTDNHADKGGTLEDREAARTGNTALVPTITYIVPEPVTALLLLAGLPMLRRRRA